MSTKKLLMGAAAVALLAATGMSASAASKDVNLSGWKADGDFEDAQNTSELIDLGAGSTVTGFEYIDLVFTTSGDSWWSELVLSVNNDTSTAWLDWMPSIEDVSGTLGPITGSYGGLSGAEGPYGSTGPFVVSSGNAWVTTYLSFSDPPSGIDIESGTLRIFYQPVPEPTTYAMLALGLLAVGAAARRRG